MLEYMLATGSRKPRFKLVPLKDSSFAASHRSVCLFNNKIYAAGGLGAATTSLNNFGVYDIATDTWSALQLLPVASRSGTIGINGNRLVYMGGYNQGPNTISNSIYTYNLSTNQWTLAANQQSPTRFETVYETLANGMQYVFGGQAGTPQVTAQRVDLTQSQVSFTNLISMNVALRAAGSLFDGGHYIYVAGGATSTVTFSTTFERYDITTGNWKKLADLPVGASYVHMIIWDNKLHALITNPGGVYTNQLYVYDIAKDSWSYVTHVDGEVHALTKSVIHNGELYLIGGWNGTNRLAKVSKLVRFY